jgi:hypothetical protein
MIGTTTTRLIPAIDLRMGDVIARPYLAPDEKAHVSLETVQSLERQDKKMKVITTYRHAAGEKSIPGETREGIQYFDLYEYVVVVRRGPLEKS